MCESYLLHQRYKTYWIIIPFNVILSENEVNLIFDTITHLETILHCIVIILCTMCESLTMPARASSVVWTCVMFPFSNRSLASNMSFGFMPYARMALMKLPRFSSYVNNRRKKKEKKKDDLVLCFCTQNLFCYKIYFAVKLKIPCKS